MASTDLSSRKLHVHTRVALRKTLNCGFAVLMCSCLLAGAAQCRARSPQDVAEAARQERTRKEQQKKSKHVYTDEDLRRAKILTPDDEARVEANRKTPPVPTEEQTQAPLDANEQLPQLPLGDIARRYRDAKRAAQPPDPFHLPFDEPVFADPVISIPNVAPPRPSFAPAHPNFSPARPHSAVAPVLPSPAPATTDDPIVAMPKVARPSTTFAPGGPKLVPARPEMAVAPTVGNPAPLQRIDPFTRRMAPARPAPAVAQPKPAEVIVPVAPKSNFAVSPNLPVAPQPGRPTSVAPPAMIEIHRAAGTVTVQAGDSLWKIAQQNLGRGSRWQELLAANPGIVDPARIAAGTEIVLPGRVTGLKSDLRITVQEGDSLSKIAKATYGKMDAWRCIAEANPEIADANRIYKGQQLLLPFACEK